MTEQTTTHKQKQLTKQVAAFAQPDTKTVSFSSSIRLFLSSDCGFLPTSASMSPTSLH